MSEQQRREAAKLRVKYAKAFSLSTEEVEVHFCSNDDFEVYAKERTDLPRWSYGTVEQ